MLLRLGEKFYQLTDQLSEIREFGDFSQHAKENEFKISVFFIVLCDSFLSDKPGTLVIYLSRPFDRAAVVNFPIRIPDFDSRGPAFLNLFIYCDPDIFSIVVF